VSEADFSDAALVLIGHGSTKNAESSAPVRMHVEALRKRGVFAQVEGCFWKQEPFILKALRGISAPRVFIVPLFIGGGYFTEQAIPRELGLARDGIPGYEKVQRRGNQTIFYCGPIGSHESMTGVILARAADIVRQFPFPLAPKPAEIALFIAGHGTELDENSRKAIERQVKIIRARNLYSEIQAAFIEEEPRISNCTQAAAAKYIVMVPFFISDGLHASQDIPELLGEPARLVRERLERGQPGWRNPTEKNGKLIWYTHAIGTETHIPEVILERVREAATE
jgi:sirohydrochlorin cobaltochelatase